MSCVIDLDGASKAAMARLVASEVIEKAIDEQITKTVIGKVKEALGEYSDFGKQVAKAVQAALAIHGDLDLPSYSDTILKIVARQVESLTKQSVESEVAVRLKKLLTPAPVQIKLSALVEQYVEFLRDKSDAGCVCYGEEQRAFAELKDSSYGYRDLTLAKTREKSKYGGRRESEIQMSFSKDCKIFQLTFANQDVEKLMFAGPLFNFERSIFQMKAAGTIIEIDCDPADCDLNYGHDRD